MIGDKAAQDGQVPNAVGHDEQFVLPVEPLEIPELRPAGQEKLPAAVNEDPLDEILPERRILEAAILLHREEGKTGHEGGGEDPDTALDRHAAGNVNLDGGHAGTGGLALEDEATKRLLLQFLQLFRRPGLHSRRVIDAGADGNQAGRRRIAHEAHGLPGDRQAIFHFRTDGDIGKITSQGFGEVPVPLVAAVITDIPAKQTGADADLDLFHGSRLLHVSFPFPWT